jgi:predicted permease
MPDGLTARLRHLLPEAARRDLFDPAAADLMYERAQRTRTVGPIGRAGLRLWYSVRVVLLTVDCARLTAADRVAAALARRPAPATPPRKEWHLMFLRDLRHAARVFVREPAFAVAVVLTLGLGIGANTALFAVVESVLLRPLPYPDADRIVRVKHRDVRTGFAKSDVAIGDFIELAARQQSFEAFGGYYGFQTALIGDGEPRRLEGLSVTPEIFGVLGLQPALGRAFTADDSQQGAPPVAIVSYEVWRTVLGSDPAILSRSLLLGTTRRLVVGVAQPGFHFPPESPTDILVPHAVPAAPPSNRRDGWIYGIGRLRPGTSLARADEDLAGLSAAFEHDHPQQNLGSRYFAETLRDELVGDTRRALIVLLAAVGFVLLIACANVGNLLLSRSLARQTEMAMRLALGAGRWRLITQTMTEGLVLACAGGVVGVVVAWRGAPALAAMVPEAVGVPGLDAVGLNPFVLAFAVGASLLSAALSSGLACVGLVRATDRTALAGQRRSTMSRGARWAASGLIVTEMAVAVVLLIGAGLTLRSFAKLIGVDPGFSTDGVVTLQMALPPGRYATAAARGAAYDRLFTAIEAAPAVEAAGVAQVTPLTGNNWTAPLVRPEHPLPAGQRPPEVGWQSASGSYFRAMRIPLRAGRLFDARDTPGSPPVAIVSDAIADQHFPGEDPVGKRLRIGSVTAEIVGRVGNIRRAGLRDAPRADLYFPFEQEFPGGTTLFVRATGDPLAALPAIRTAIRQAEPDALVFQVRTMAEIAAASAATTRLAMRLLGGFAAIALALAAIGIYGVMSYAVRRRTREFGTRLALGATRADIVRLVLRQAATTAALGLVCGIAVGLIATRALASMLFDTPPWDLLSLSVAALVLALAAGLASYLPARRAAHVDPTETLASE